MINEQEEIWKDIIIVRPNITYDFSGNYQVSNLGNVKSLKYKKERILKQSFSDDGYRQVSLYFNKKNITFKVHKLVAEMFLEKPKDYYEKDYTVDHIIEISKGGTNEVTNLQYLLRYENIQKSFKNEENKEIIQNRIEQIKKWRESEEGKEYFKTRQKKVCKLNIKTNQVIKIFDSIKEASKDVNCHNSVITKCCKNKIQTVKGFKYKYYEDYEKERNEKL